ncbi:M42 family metallopeptidase [Halobacillus salinarum]|uniref:M42 family metallopeptidase n=1 Tax=Halobacillus salinarum TaxID=2932257 RepID=UPI0037C07A9F
MTHHLKQLTSIPSPTGMTEQIMRYCDNLLRVKGVPTMMTNKGGLIATIQGRNPENERVITAHLDTLGAMVKEVKDDGKLALSLIGGFTWNSIEGEYCEIHTASDGTYTGTILMQQSSVHVYKESGEKKRDSINMVVRLDEMVHSKQDVQKLGIEVGDFVSFAPRYEESKTGFIKSRHLDDKASAAVLLHMIEEIVDANIEIPYTTHFYFSNNEEIGYGANSSIPETVREFIAVDMGAVGDGQTSTEYDVSICAKDSSGPYHLGLRHHFTSLAKQNDINYQIDIYPYYGSDASAVMKAGSDVKHALVGPGIDASHAYERTHTDSLIYTYQLLMAYIQSELIP